MLTLGAGQVETLWDEALPIEARELPADLAALDVLLADGALLDPIVALWRREEAETGRAVLSEGRPTIAMETYVRLMVLKARYRWGYRVLVAEVSDSIHLRRFCRIALTERVPDESTVRKLTRRIGAETVNELTRLLIASAVREKRFRPRAVRIDSTVIEADVKYPTDAGLASHGVKALAREGKKLAKRIGVLKLTAQTGELLERSIKETRRIVALARRRARGRGAPGEAERGSQVGGVGRSLREGRQADQAARRIRVAAAGCAKRSDISMTSAPSRPPRFVARDRSGRRSQSAVWRRSCGPNA